MCVGKEVVQKYEAPSYTNTNTWLKVFAVHLPIVFKVSHVRF